MFRQTAFWVSITAIGVILAILSHLGATIFTWEYWATVAALLVLGVSNQLMEP